MLSNIKLIRSDMADIISLTGIEGVIDENGSINYEIFDRELANIRQKEIAEQLTTGVYKINHFNSHSIIGEECDEYPSLESGTNCYGVCDNYQQILDCAPEIEEDPEHKYVIFITPVEKKEQSETGGWRWHKWGPYIGDQNPKCEYLADEPDIEKVYVYHVHEVL